MNERRTRGSESGEWEPEAALVKKLLYYEG